MEHSMMLQAILTLLVLLALYFLPSIIAELRNKPNALAIIATNLLLGWTVIGWLICLIWSLMTPPKAATSQIVYVQGPAPVAPAKEQQP